MLKVEWILANIKKNEECNLEAGNFVYYIVYKCRAVIVKTQKKRDYK